MGIADAIRDTLKIVSDPLGRAGRSEFFGTYVRLAGQSRRKQPGETAVLGNVIGYLDPSNLLQVFREIFITRLYEMPISSSKPTIVHCGSNVGMSLLYFRLTYPEASIVGFGPNPRAFKVLRENVARNRTKNVSVHQVALGDTTGTVDFFLPKDLGVPLSAVAVAIQKVMRPKAPALNIAKMFARLRYDTSRIASLAPAVKAESARAPLADEKKPFGAEPESLPPARLPSVRQSA